jgi:hypothetical protein
MGKGTPVLLASGRYTVRSPDVARKDNAVVYGYLLLVQIK